MYQVERVVKFLWSTFCFWCCFKCCWERHYGGSLHVAALAHVSKGNHRHDDTEVSVFDDNEEEEDRWGAVEFGDPDSDGSYSDSEDDEVSNGGAGEALDDFPADRDPGPRGRPSLASIDGRCEAGARREGGTRARKDVCAPCQRAQPCCLFVLTCPRRRADGLPLQVRQHSLKSDATTASGAWSGSASQSAVSRVSREGEDRGVTAAAGPWDVGSAGVGTGLPVKRRPTSGSRGEDPASAAFDRTTSNGSGFSLELPDQPLPPQQQMQVCLP
jgi:hypothetical protein